MGVTVIGVRLNAIRHFIFIYLHIYVCTLSYRFPQQLYIPVRWLPFKTIDF